MSLLRAEEIASLLTDETNPDPLSIIPEPNIAMLQKSGSASVDLRLGCWFASIHKSSVSLLAHDTCALAGACDETYIPFGKEYILHPHDFVLAVTLEWVSIPAYLAAYIQGKSSWGRRGLIIATASVIHPGFRGCITLEVTNLGEVPISITPGIYIAQLCLHHATVRGENSVDKSSFSGKRKPIVGNVQRDNVALSLMQEINR